MVRIHHVVGARPNFIKMAPVFAALKRGRRFDQSIVHTGQHFSRQMSDVFFEDLNLPRPITNLRVTSTAHVERIAKMMLGLHRLWQRSRPDFVLVYGDVSSSLAAALAAAKAGIRFGHVEAGMRSFDRSMPEEINRLLIDQLADVLFAPSIEARKNLEREGISRGRIIVVGNVAIDTLRRFRAKAKLCAIEPPEKYAVVTLHRPSNVDDPVALQKIWNGLLDYSSHIPLIFPVHPRTRKNLAQLSNAKKTANIRLVEPMRYLEFLALMRDASIILTDSGGVQAEADYLKKPCFVLRDTFEVGKAGQFASTNLRVLKPLFLRFIAKTNKTRRATFNSDGHASDRIRAALVSFLSARRSSSLEK